MTQSLDPIVEIQQAEALAGERLKASQEKLQEASQTEAAKYASELEALRQNYLAELNGLEAKVKDELADFIATTQTKSKTAQEALTKSANSVMPQLAKEIATQIVER